MSLVWFPFPWSLLFLQYIITSTLFLKLIPCVIKLTKSRQCEEEHLVQANIQPVWTANNGSNQVMDCGDQASDRKDWTRMFASRAEAGRNLWSIFCMDMVSRSTRVGCFLFDDAANYFLQLTRFVIDCFLSVENVIRFIILWRRNQECLQPLLSYIHLRLMEPQTYQGPDSH